MCSMLTKNLVPGIQKPWQWKGQNLHQLLLAGTSYVISCVTSCVMVHHPGSLCLLPRHHARHVRMNLRVRPGVTVVVGPTVAPAAAVAVTAAIGAWALSTEREPECEHHDACDVANCYARAPNTVSLLTSYAHYIIHNLQAPLNWFDSRGLPFCKCESAPSSPGYIDASIYESCLIYIYIRVMSRIHLYMSHVSYTSIYESCLLYIYIWVMSPIHLYMSHVSDTSMYESCLLYIYVWVRSLIHLDMSQVSYTSIYDPCLLCI